MGCEVRRTPGRPRLLGKMNAGLLLEVIRDQGPLSRPQLASATGLSLPTVNSRVGELLAAGYVREDGWTRSTGGKRARLLRFNEDFGYVVGLDVGGHQVSVAVADLSGDIVHFERRPLGTRVDAGSILKASAEMVENALAASRVSKVKVMAVGVSTPGLVDPSSGEVALVPNIPGWASLGPARRLEEMLGVRPLLENNVNAAIVGEHWKGVARGCDDAVFVAIGTGIGAGIMIGGKLYRGFHGGAGEIGLQRDFEDDQVLDEEFGPFERRASGLGIAQRYRELAGEGEEMTTRKIFAAARQGDELARRVISEASSVLAGGIVNLCAILDPEMVVLGGGVARAGEEIAGPVRRRLHSALPAPPSLMLSALGDRVSVVGAAKIALDAALKEEPLLGSQSRMSGKGE